MANTKVSDLPELTTPNNAMEFYINDTLVPKKINWGNMKNSLTSTTVKLSDYTVMDNDGYDRLIINPNTSTQYGITNITLPSASTNLYRTIEVVYGADGNTNGGMVKILSQGSDKINCEELELTFLYLYHPTQYITIFSDGTNWLLKSSKIYIDSLYNNRSNYSFVNFGFMTVTYDNLSGSILTGSTVVETGGNACVGTVIYDSGTQIILYNLQNGGVFTNNNVLTFSNGATALVNETSGNNKNQNTSLYHGLGIPMAKISTKVIMSTDGTEDNSFDVKYHGDSGTYGGQIVQNDTNSLKFETGNNGLLFLNNLSSWASILNDDWYIRFILKIF